MKSDIRVWDLPTRLFHWLLAGSFAGAWLTAESERLQLAHITLGYTLLGLIAFRVVWGFFGSRWARFRSFPPSPRAALDYARELLRPGQGTHYTGHNPLGALAVYGLLLLGAAVGLSGYGYLAMDLEWLGDAHELLAATMLGLAGLHVAGVIISSRKHRENLVKGMVTGYKPGKTADAIRGNGWAPGLLLLAMIGAFWLSVWLRPSLLQAPEPADEKAQAENISVYDNGDRG